MQDYITESDNLVLLHDQIRDCDIILSQMETILSGFQVPVVSSLFWFFYFLNIWGTIQYTVGACSSI